MTQKDMNDVPAIFIHVPSTAGTSLWEILKKGSHKKIKRFYDNRNFNINAELAENLLIKKGHEFSIIGGHFNFGLKNPDGNLSHFTFIRDPVDRIQSAWFRKVRNGLRPKAGSAETPNLSDLINFAKSSRFTQVLMLTGIPEKEIKNNLEQNDPSVIIPQYAELARNNFAFIGHTSRFNLDLFKLAKFLGWRNVPLYDFRNIGGNRQPIPEDIKHQLIEILNFEIQFCELLKNAPPQNIDTGMLDKFQYSLFLTLNRIRRFWLRLTDDGYSERYVKKVKAQLTVKQSIKEVELPNGEKKINGRKNRESRKRKRNKNI